MSLFLSLIQTAPASFFAQDFDGTMHHVQAAIQEHALALAAGRGIVLDYSENSIEQLDILLGSIANELHTAGLTTEASLRHAEGVPGIAEALGHYIVACLERGHGKGTWLKTPEHAWPAYTPGTSHSVILPMDWVMKKLTNPEILIESRYRKLVRSRQPVN